MCVLNGTILLYASTTIPNPNEVSYDWKMECSDCDACEIYVDPEDFEVISADEPQRRRRQAIMNVTEEIVYTNFTVYVSVEGVEDRNTFQLDSDVGDTTGRLLGRDINYVEQHWKLMYTVPFINTHM